MSEGTDERMQKAAVEYRVGQRQNSQETVLASRVSPTMRPSQENNFSLKLFQGLIFCTWSLSPASCTVRNTEVVGESAQGVEPARIQNIPLDSRQTQHPFCVHLLHFLPGSKMVNILTHIFTTTQLRLLPYFPKQG